MKDAREGRAADMTTTADAEVSSGPSLEEVLEHTRSRGLDVDAASSPGDVTPAVAAAGGCLLGECLEDRHPVLRGRVLVRVDGPAGERRFWAPTLQGLAIRPRDRVLLIRPGNASEWIVSGVVDGLAARPEPPTRPAATIELKPDESIQVVASSGAPVLEVRPGAEGPVVRLLRADVRVELPGALEIAAGSIALEATEGKVEIKASDDVVVQGELVRLN
ncbi:MAG: hypothetical protein R3B09_28070 [Nannocystaceae bacterium]